MMKRLYTTLLFLALASINFYAQTPGWASKAVKSVFTLTTFREDGSILSSANGFFVGNNGEAISSFTPFNGAYSAVIVDASGKKYNVECMLGANEIYDVAKFRVANIKSQPLTIAGTDESKGSTVWLLPYSIKSPACKQGTITKAEPFQTSYTYYTIAVETPENSVSCPFLNQKGEVIGINQPPVDPNSKESYAVSATFASSLKITGLSMNENALKSIKIKSDLPDELDQAIVTLYMAAQGQQDRYKEVVEQFINKFPNSSDGYIAKAQMEADNENFAGAKSDMERAIKVADKKDDVHYSYSKLIYQKKLYSQSKYQDAYNTYIELSKTPLRNGEIFYDAAQCKSQLKASDDELLALLDSAVSCFSKPYLKEAAPYLLARGSKLYDMKKYRESVADYNEYENLMRAELNDRFYYLREQAEVNGRIYKQALDDIAKAIEMNPKEPTYYAEQANLMLRVNMLDDGIKSATKCITIAPEDADGYLILGILQIKKGNKADGLQNLQKAKTLGNSQADALIQKYK